MATRGLDSFFHIHHMMYDVSAENTQGTSGGDGGALPSISFVVLSNKRHIRLSVQHADWGNNVFIPLKATPAVGSETGRR